MAKHVPLPSVDVKSKSPPQKQANSGSITPVTQALADRTALQVDPGHHVYVLRLSLLAKGIGGFIFLTHRNKFEGSELAAMTDEAVKVCNEVRIPQRRKQMADQKVPVNPDEVSKINETWFTGDVDFVEAVMIDKYQFRKLIHYSSAGEVVPTIVVG